MFIYTLIYLYIYYTLISLYCIWFVLCAMCRREFVFIWIYMWFTNVVLNMCAVYIVIAVVYFYLCF